MFLQLKTSSWNDDKNTDMYCYFPQLADKYSRTIRTNQPITLFRDKSTYQIVQQTKIKQCNQQSYEQLISIEKSKKGFYIVNSDDHQKQSSKIPIQPLYIVCTATIQITEKDYIKLGKSSITINRIKLQKIKNKNKCFFQQNQLQIYTACNRIHQSYYDNSTHASTIDEAPACRYCYCKSMDNSNPLMASCHCQGSTKYVHKRCLQQWVTMNSGYVDNIQSGISYCSKKGVVCELCRHAFNIEQLLPCFSRECFREYVQLTKCVQQTQTVYFIGLTRDITVNIGRKLDNQISLQDLAVSRLHCQLHWDSLKKQLHIEDLKSKFGTLIKKQLVEIKQGTMVADLQRGRTRLQVQLICKNKSASGKSGSRIKVYK